MSIWERKHSSKRQREERMNRQGNWVRAFHYPKDPWPILEHWASENKYHLVALRGDRRLYKKDYFFSHYQALLDIKREENSVSMSVWIEVSFLLRFLSLFQLPQTLTLFPKGFWGIRVRRNCCQEINQLLFRFRQVPVRGTSQFHWADLELSTLILFGLSFLPLFAFLLFPLKNIEIFPGLSPRLLELIGSRFLLLAGLGLVVTVTQHWLSQRWVRPLFLQSVSAAALFVLYSASSVLLITGTSRALIETRWGFHCVQKPSSTTCSDLTRQLDEKRRGELLQRLQVLEKELAIKH